MDKIKQTVEIVKELIGAYGAKDTDQIVKDYIFRNYTNPEVLEKGGAYFGIISSDEETSGPYHDFSLVVFPDKEDKQWLIALIVGSLGFKKDYELASYPGVKRLFSSFIGEKGFIKTSFLDIETTLPLTFKNEIPHLRRTMDIYSNLIVACEIIEDPTSEEGKRKIAAFVAAYAKIRGFGNKAQKKEMDRAIAAAFDQQNNGNKTEDENKVLSLLKKRRFVILQGAPGTGKTRLAKLIAQKLEAEMFFTQFHAETSYSDFIYGIRPDLEAGEVAYVEQKGIFYESLKKAESNPGKNVVLIVDEINRANLSNILGPVFYLFEYQLDDNTVEIDIGGVYTIREIPSNYYVVCTMNTADRSLDVVDFALRRRFAWYTLKPHIIEPTGNKKFFEKDFSKFDDVFNWYANSEELSLQPGQAYFIAENEEEMKDRIKYELLPLIREYLAEGLIVNAKDEFSKYFYDRIGEVLFE